MMESLIAGKACSVAIFNEYLASHELDVAREGRFGSGFICKAVDYIIQRAIEVAKMVVDVKGPGYIPENWRFNGVDFGSHCFTYPWETEWETAQEEYSESRFTNFFERAVQEQNLVPKYWGRRGRRE